MMPHPPVAHPPVAHPPSAHPPQGDSHPQAGPPIRPHPPVAHPLSAHPPQGDSHPQAGPALQPHGSAAQPLSQELGFLQLNNLLNMPPFFAPPQHPLSQDGAAAQPQGPPEVSQPQAGLPIRPHPPLLHPLSQDGAAQPQGPPVASHPHAGPPPIRPHPPLAHPPLAHPPLAHPPPAISHPHAGAVSQQLLFLPQPIIRDKRSASADWLAQKPANKAIVKINRFIRATSPLLITRTIFLSWKNPSLEHSFKDAIAGRSCRRSNPWAKVRSLKSVRCGNTLPLTSFRPGPCQLMFDLDFVSQGQASDIQCPRLLGQFGKSFHNECRPLISGSLLAIGMVGSVNYCSGQF